jgi:hypothetical protein
MPKWATDHRTVIPAPDLSIRGQASAGIHFATVKSQWIPAFAGMTIFRIRAPCTFVVVNKAYFARV